MFGANCCTYPDVLYERPDANTVLRIHVLFSLHGFLIIKKQHKVDIVSLLLMPGQTIP